MKWYKNMLIGLILSTATIMGACNDNNASADIDLSDYPESVKNGEVSIEYYDEVNRFYSESPDYLEEMNRLITLEAESKDILNNQEHIKTFTALLNEYNESLSSFTAKPKTKADKEISFQMEKVIHFQLQLNNFKLDHLKTKDSNLEMEMASTSLVIENILEDLDNVVIKYEVIK